MNIARLARIADTIAVLRAPLVKEKMLSRVICSKVADCSLLQRYVGCSGDSFSCDLPGVHNLNGLLSQLVPFST